MREGPRPEPYPGSMPMMLLPPGAACLEPVHREHGHWWADTSAIGTAEGLATAEAAAWVCRTSCPREVFTVCEAISQDIRPSAGVWAAVAWVSGATYRGNIHGHPSTRCLAC